MEKLNIKNNISDFFKKYYKILLYVLIFCIFVFIYNQNIQFLNNFFKRGCILEYSIDRNVSVNKKAIKKELSNLNIKYSSIDEADLESYLVYDADNNKIDKALYIALPILAKKDSAALLDKISDYIFREYKYSKLTDIKSLNYNYNTPYSGFLIFLNLAFASFIIWLTIMYFILGFKKLNNDIKNSIVSFFRKLKENTSNLIKNTRKEGIGYFLKKLLLDNNEEDDEKDGSITKEIISTIVFVLLCVIIIRYFVGELRWIPSGSMRPTILEKDRVFVEKLDYPKKEIKRGDILVFYPPETQLSDSPLALFSRLTGIFCKDIAYIKRAIGLPGDKFEIKRNSESGEYRVYINNKPLNEPYISSKIEWTYCRDDMYCGPFTIPEGHYFMMGDNRNNSQDSRFWGFLDEKRVIGRANFMFWPIKRINILGDKYLDLHKNTREKQKYILNRYEFLYRI